MNFFDETIFVNGENFIPFKQVNVYNRADAFLVERLGLTFNDANNECLSSTLRNSKSVTNIPYNSNSQSLNLPQQASMKTTTLSSTTNMKPIPAIRRRLITNPLSTTSTTTISELVKKPLPKSQLSTIPSKVPQIGHLPTNEISQMKFAQTPVNLNPRNPCRGINIYSFNIANNRIEKTIGFNQIIIVDANAQTVPIIIDEFVPDSIYDVGELTAFESAIMIKYYAINNPNVYITRHLYRKIVKYFDDRRDWFNYKPIGIVENSRHELIENNTIINIPNVDFADEYLPLY